MHLRSTERERLKNEAQEEPVIYCRQCLSLNIMVEGDMDVCGNCGSVDTNWTDIDRWEIMYTKRYGKPLINKKR